jgi:nicotinamide-nucleotide amidase
MIAETLSVGTELLLGQIVDTNAAAIARLLPTAGVDLYRRSTVGDNPARIEEEIRLSLSRADIVITIGGLGPTEDDLTKEIAAKTLGVDLAPSTTHEAWLRAFSQQRGLSPAPSFFKQAMIPAEGFGRAIPNPNGTALGVIIENNNKIVACLPGPPNEFLPMAADYLIPYLKEKNANNPRAILSKTLRIIGIGESEVEQRVIDLLHNDNPSIAPLAKPGECWLRITASAKDDETANALIQPLEDEIRARLGDAVYAADEESLEEIIVNLARQKNAWIATAESCTGGLLAHRITSIPGASDIYATGVITYANQTKIELADVNPATIEAHGAVSAETAAEMAIGVRKRYGATIGLATTGIAGPGGGTDTKPVGLVYVAIAKPDGSAHVEGHVYIGQRTHVMQRATQTALIMARNALLEM